MIKNYIEKANFEDTGFSYTLSLISGKHKMVILYCLMEFEIVRFNELKRYLKHVSDKTLSSNLKELEADRLIIRKEYPQIPPKVEYCLSGRGRSLVGVLDQLCIWGENNRDQKGNKSTLSAQNADAHGIDKIQDTHGKQHNGEKRGQL